MILSRTEVNDMDEQLLSPRRAAEILSCSEPLIRKWIRVGTLPAVKLGRLVRVRKADVEAAIRLGLGSKRSR